MKVMLVLWFGLVLSGCSAVDVPAVISAMGTDPASVCIHISSSVYTPSFDLVRVNSDNVSANCGSTTMTTVPTPGTGMATITVPVTIVPK